MATGDVTCNLTNALPKRCAVFDGVDDKVVIADSVSVKLPIFTISFWALPKSPGAGNYGVVLDKDSGDGFYIYLNRNNWNIKTGGTNAATFIGYSKGVWQYMTFIYDGTNTIIYKNNVLGGSDVNPAPNYSTEDLWIGNRTSDSARCFDGSICNLKIWDKVLSSAERTTDYNGGNVTDGLVSRWKLSEDYKDSVGSNDGTNSGSYLSAVDDQVATAISDARTTANDKYLMAVVNNKIMTSVIEES
jgi:hypothetical protein